MSHFYVFEASLHHSLLARLGVIEIEKGMSDSVYVFQKFSLLRVVAYLTMHPRNLESIVFAFKIIIKYGSTESSQTCFTSYSGHVISNHHNLYRQVSLSSHLKLNLRSRGHDKGTREAQNRKANDFVRCHILHINLPITQQIPNTTTMRIASIWGDNL